MEQRTPWEVIFSGFKTNPQGEDHEGTFIDYYRYRPNARYRRIRPITERATEEQPTPRGAKSNQFKFVGASGVLVDCFFAEFDAVRPEHPIDAFRGTEIGDHDQPVDSECHGQQCPGTFAGSVKSGCPAIAGQWCNDGTFAGSIHPTGELTYAGAEQYGSAAK